MDKLGKDLIFNQVDAVGHVEKVWISNQLDIVGHVKSSRLVRLKSMWQVKCDFFWS